MEQPSCDYEGMSPRLTAHTLGVRNNGVGDSAGIENPP